MTLTDLQKSVKKLPPLADIRQFGRSASQRAILEPLMSELGVKPIRIDDVTRRLGLSQGKVLALRWDITTGETGFKQPVMCALLLFHLWRRRGSAGDVSVLTDGGNVNTALAMSYLASQLGLQAEHVLSRHFPDDIRAYMLAHGHGCLKLIEAPPSRLGREKEFYAFLLEMMRDPSRRSMHLCLWHAKYSGIATRWMGETFAESWEIAPDDIVMGLGSGSTLEGYAIPLKERFGGKPRIVVAEHLDSRLICDAPLVADLSKGMGKRSQHADEFRAPPQAVPHMVLGPHYDDVNPLLPGCDLANIGAIVRYSDPVWQEASHHCRQNGMSVGNSSAANLAVARHLASDGRTVFTFIYEPLRDFYVQPQQISASCAGYEDRDGSRFRGEFGVKVKTPR